MYLKIIALSIQKNLFKLKKTPAGGGEISAIKSLKSTQEKNTFSVDYEQFGNGALDTQLARSKYELNGRMGTIKKSSYLGICAI